MNVRIPTNKNSKTNYFQKMQSMYNFINNNLDDMRIIPEGTKVKLNYDSLTNEPSYRKKVQAYRDFIENNKDTIFTVQYDEKYKDKPILVSLQEDTNKVKWLFHYEYDLIVVDNIQ